MVGNEPLESPINSNKMINIKNEALSSNIIIVNYPDKNDIIINENENINKLNKELIKDTTPTTQADINDINNTSQILGSSKSI